ncbi:MAG: hypothetical protein AVDCRST_MAG12-3445 [uncultured Rubrobacteraceae bacterium]|uniref:Transglutaminase-like domain-containing protein n=1 Tax=uncultured Rubrobacteraceae bacterium TaxID=349277 RepID=A0A6J4T6L5_9ACTN|nr:MAG: hypothetical protein AVDCRST_MAG12-3445 [uncultured Rubrobacteraceae bacterium]
MGAEALANFSLHPDGEVASGFVAQDLEDFHAAVRHVRDLPYGRNSDRSDYRLVLGEARGTCSTKHALLAALAREHGAPVELRLGVYLMDGRNTPGVGPVLLRHGLSALPEAHCYLACRGVRVDVTRAQARIPGSFLREETIAPEQIGAHKVAAHRDFLRAWATERGLDPGLVWLARERCIAALSGRNAQTRTPSR